jgi:polysaccharide export outer membrane protein
MGAELSWPTGSRIIAALSRIIAAASRIAAPLLVRRPAGWLVGLGLGLMLLGGCASGGKIVSREVRRPFTAQQRTFLSTARSAEQRLQRGDRLSVIFEFRRELDQYRILVLPDGSASFIGLDRIVVAGKTVSELDSLLTAGYAQQYRDPDLSVVVEEVAGLPVYVLGEVRSPGLYDVSNQGFGVLNALSLAGGYQPRAKRGPVLQIRISPEGYICRELNLNPLLKGKQVDLEMFDLEPYDIIYIPTSWQTNFAAFTHDVVGSLIQMTTLILNSRYIDDPSAIWRR